MLRDGEETYFWQGLKLLWKSCLTPLSFYSLSNKKRKKKHTVTKLKQWGSLNLLQNSAKGQAHWRTCGHTNWPLEKQTDRHRTFWSRELATMKKRRINKKNKIIHHEPLDHTLSIVINTVFHLARPDLVYIVNTIENVPVLNIIKLETYQTDLNNSFTHFVLIN